MRLQRETVACHVAGRVDRQRGRGLRRRGHHTDPDLPDLRAAHDADAEPEEGAVFTVVSIARSFALRRVFEAFRVRWRE